MKILNFQKKFIAKNFFLTNKKLHWYKNFFDKATYSHLKYNQKKLCFYN